jgi:hypothetical protein
MPAGTRRLELVKCHVFAAAHTRAFAMSPQPSAGAAARRAGRCLSVLAEALASLFENAPQNRLLATVVAPSVARLEKSDLYQSRELGLELVPDPPREHLAGRILEPLHLVEITMIETVVNGSPKVVKHREVHDPSRVWVDQARDCDLDLEGMPVQARALVSLGYPRETMSGLETKLVNQSDGMRFHGIEARILGLLAVRCNLFALSQSTATRQKICRHEGRAPQARQGCRLRPQGGCAGPCRRLKAPVPVIQD